LQDQLSTFVQQCAYHLRRTRRGIIWKAVSLIHEINDADILWKRSPVPPNNCFVPSSLRNDLMSVIDRFVAVPGDMKTRLLDRLVEVATRKGGRQRQGYYGDMAQFRDEMRNIFCKDIPFDVYKRELVIDQIIEKVDKLTGRA
jgi:hypothetical protein